MFDEFRAYIGRDGKIDKKGTETVLSRIRERKVISIDSFHAIYSISVQEYERIKPL